ncbi:hypothetical protein A3L09_03305 [Thermococcus profundus]|uniref:Aldehyde ferredoxin oxidoreductase N-terminal domain-containing protein n=1 Tax=Thermococcus profundus TaxID=49899 RepID=A0A2Z2M9E5_THEPR|nr:aldehyde ferredoxin oxidoreductase family protein [Thermococcus profundus]ASJ02346.1 hypothetical protein A3L09_03305 [Thermococcus profundus]
MLKMSGYTGEILFVDLSSGTFRTEPTEKYAKDFLGGRGIATRILYENPDALAFMTGPLTSFVPSGSRMDVVGISPVTGLIGGSSTGGEFPVALKFAGYDGIVVTGKSEKPVFIRIEDSEVSIESAGELWGLNAFETIDTLTKDDPDLKVACIGRAGENGVKFAGIAFSHRNLASRGGLGAVMGAKKLKAIVVHGTKAVSPHDPNELMSIFEKIKESIVNSGEFLRFKDWHVNFVPTILKLKMPYFGDYEREWEKAEEAAMKAKEWFERHTVGRASCFSCPLRCWGVVNYEGETLPINLCQGTFPAVTFTLKTEDPELAWRIYRKCQSEGLDMMSATAVIAYASRLGLVRLGTEEVLELIEKIVTRQDEGNILAEGIKKASEHFGVPAVYMKGGMESWSSDVRPFVGSALAAAVADSGSVNRALYGFPEFYYHIKKEQAEMMATRFVGDVEAAYPWSYSESKVRFAVLWENLHIIADSLGVCVIALLTTPLKLWAEAYEAVTGEKIAEEELMTAAERIRTLERLFTLKHGDGRDDLSPRLFKDEPRLDKEKLEEMKRVYYSLRGWDEKGVPKPETIEKLGISGLVEL